MNYQWVIHLAALPGTFYWYSPKLMSQMDREGFEPESMSLASARVLWNEVGTGGPIQILGERGV